MPLLNLVEAVNTALREEMRRDENVLVLGEDVGRAGGVFRATQGLYEEFGPQRVIDTPLSELAIVGVSIGLALYGFKPIPEIQFVDFIYPAFDQIASELAKLRYRSGGEYKAPLVIRSPYGAGVKAGPYHSQSPEALFAHIAGLKLVIPSSPREAKGLLKASIRSDDPIIFLEPKRLYRAFREEVPEDEDFTLPLGEARVVREGEDVSIFCYGAMVPLALEAADRASEEGIRVEVIDIRTLIPLDAKTILVSIKRTGRGIILYEAPKTMGFGAEIAATIAEKAIDYLKAPLQRVASLDTPVPYAHEERYLPSLERLLRAIRRAVGY